MGLISGFYFLCLLIFAVTVWGQVPSGSGNSSANGLNPLLTQQENEIRQKAKKRVYPGGRDEEPLKVQAQIVAPTRKMAPSTEPEPEEPDPSSDHD